MKKHIVMKFVGTLVLGLVACIALSGNAQAQDTGEEIEILNQDGEPVKGAIRVIQKGNAQAAGGATIKVQGGIEKKDGKLIVTDADGNQQEIDIQGAQSIIVNQAVESVTENGENKTKRVGKAIIVGPDGKRHEIELGGPMVGDGMQFSFPGFDGVVRAERMNNKFMIGVNCEPVSEALRTQLQLDEGTGLVVLNVSQDSPAQAAGIEKHDILMFADDRQLSSQSDLVEVVQTVGKEKGKVSLTLIRAGKEMGLDVSPVERPDSSINGMPDIFRAFPDKNGRGFNMQFRQMGPGLIIGDELNKDFHIDIENQMKEVEARMEAMREQLEKQLETQLQKDKDN